MPGVDQAPEGGYTQLWKIGKRNFQILVGLFFGIATILLVARCILRIKLRRRLFLDDFFVFAAVLCLVVSTASLYKFTDGLFFLNDIAWDAEVVAAVNNDNAHFFSGVMTWTYIFMCFTWSAIFAIKFSFLLFFRTLLASVSKSLTIYYWFVFFITSISWVYVSIEPFFWCSNTGLEAAIKCAKTTHFKARLALVAIQVSLDMVTDAMIISIPILLLRMTRLQWRQKADVALFLCLSVGMIVVGFIRTIGGAGPSGKSRHALFTIWGIFWLHFEACIAVSMGSITAFRGIFAGRDAAQNDSREKGRAFEEMLAKMCRWRSRNVVHTAWKPDCTGTEISQGPQIQNDPITRPTMQSLCRFIRKCGRESGHTTVSEVSNIDPLQEYHYFQREQKDKSAETSEHETIVVMDITPADPTK